MDLQAFYTTVTSISCTLLGLWWVVVEGRETWRMNVARRRMAAAWILMVEPSREGAS